MAFFVTIFQAHNHALGEGMAWGNGRLTAVDADTTRFEGVQVFTFL